jgi:hypothetical protein
LIKTKDGLNFFKSRIKPSGILSKKKKVWKGKCGSNSTQRFKLKFLNGPKSKKELRLNLETMIWLAKNARHN